MQAACIQAAINAVDAKNPATYDDGDKCIYCDQIVRVQDFSSKCSVMESMWHMSCMAKDFDLTDPDVQRTIAHYQGVRAKRDAHTKLASSANTAHCSTPPS